MVKQISQRMQSRTLTRGDLVNTLCNKINISKLPNKLQVKIKDDISLIVSSTIDKTTGKIKKEDSISVSENINARLRGQLGLEKYKAMKKLNFLIMKLNTMRSCAIEFEVPQKYEEKIVERMETNVKK